MGRLGTLGLHGGLQGGYVGPLLLCRDHVLL